MRTIADGVYQNAATVAAVKKAARVPLQIVKHSDTAKGFICPSAGSISQRVKPWISGITARTGIMPGNDGVVHER